MQTITLEVSDELATQLIPLRQELPQLLARLVANIVESPPQQARQAKIHNEAMAWRALPLATRQQYAGQFVAVHNGQVIDSDLDRLELYRRIQQKLGHVPVLITPAHQPSPREFSLHSPRLSHP